MLTAQISPKKSFKMKSLLFLDNVKMIGPASVVDWMNNQHWDRVYAETSFWKDYGPVRTDLEVG